MFCLPSSIGRFASALLSGFAAFTLAASAGAQVPVTIVSSNGNVSTQTASYGIAPSGGATLQNLLTTINPAASLPANGSLGTTPSNTNVTALNSYFGLAAGTLAGLNAQDGSGILTQQLTLTAGLVLRFDYIFLTNEDNTTSFNNDRAFFTVNGVIAQTLYTAAQVNIVSTGSPNFNLQSQGTASVSGYQTVTYSVPSTGNYVFGFGVIDVTTNTVYSGLLIDNIQVPEPATTALLVFGFGGTALAAWRRRPRS